MRFKILTEVNGGTAVEIWWKMEEALGKTFKKPKKE